MSTDYIYWTFSSAAQSVSAFVAFLLTGYALVHSLMESARLRDDSLDEIHAVIRVSQHLRLTVLAWLTAFAIILSLAIVYWNQPNAAVPGWSQLLVAAVDVSAILGGLWFVVSIVDPRKYQKAAQQVLKDSPVAGSHVSTPVAQFFDAFLHLERLVRNFLQERGLYIPSRGAPRMSYSFRQMIEALLQNELIDRKLYDELLAINRYRNLVFHGHVDEADANMLQRVASATQQIDGL